MKKNFGYNYSLRRNKKFDFKKTLLISCALMILQIVPVSILFFSIPLPMVQAATSTDQLCVQTPLDVVLVMDRSGSMGYTSKCVWWEFNYDSYEWIQNTTNDQSQILCDAKNQDAPYQSIWTGYDPTKIAAAKQAAKDFLNSMKSLDQSALVSFANTATLDKMLSNDHPQTQTAVENLVVVGATNIGDAIDKGIIELLSSRANPMAVKTMILLTDGKANKPNGPGYGEFAPDVAYAESKADEAATSNMKIYTVGLGTNHASGDINEDMLKYIASTTGAKYYHAPTPGDLSDIYNTISNEICTFCGDKIKNGNEQCDGTDGVGAHQSCSDTCKITNIPYCGDGIINNSENCDDGINNGKLNYCNQSCTGRIGSGVISGYKYKDSDGLASTTDDRTAVPNWVFELFNSSSSTPLMSTTTNANGYFEFIQLLFGSYTVTEVNQTNWTPVSSSTIAVTLSEAATSSINNNFVNYFASSTNTSVCGDGIVNQTNEQCDNGTSNGSCPASCSSTCQSNQCGSSGGGGSTSNGGGSGTLLCILDNTCGGASGFLAESSNPVSAPVVKGEEGKPILQITKSVSRKLTNPGDSGIEYTITVSNKGNLTAFAVNIEDVLPSGLVFNDGGGTLKEWKIGDLAEGAQKVIKYKVDVKSDAMPKIYINTATAQATNHDPVSSSAQLEVTAVKVLAFTGFSMNELLLLLGFIFSSLILARSLKRFC